VYTGKYERKVQHMTKIHVFQVSKFQPVAVNGVVYDPHREALQLDMDGKLKQSSPYWRLFRAHLDLKGYQVVIQKIMEGIIT